MNEADTLICLPESAYEDIWDHLLGEGQTEETAFLYAVPVPTDAGLRLKYLEWEAIPPEGYVSRSGAHLELRDKVRASVIKKAFDLEASLIEFHSHTGPWAARFSISDHYGFRDFVPHVMWRLDQRPYGAVVVARDDYDALVWRSEVGHAERIVGIDIGKEVLKPTNLSDLEARWIW